MKKIMLATTALFALSGISVAAADISISGHVRFHYDSWSDNILDKDGAGDNNNSMSTDPEIWVKGAAVTDGGLTIAPEARIKGEDGKIARHYIKLMDDWGTIILGRHHTPVYTMSLGADWRGTVSGVPSPVGSKDPTRQDFSEASAVMLNSGGTKVTADSDEKIVYITPSLGGFKAGLSFADAGGSSKANATEAIVQYSLPAFGDGTFTVSAANSRKDAKDGANESRKLNNSEFGVAIKKGPFLLSAIQLNQKSTPKKEQAMMDTTVKQTGREVEVAYDATDNLTLSVVAFNAKVDKGITAKRDSAGKLVSPAASISVKDDKFESIGIGAKYTVAPGLYVSLGYNSFKYTNKAGLGQDLGLKNKNQNKGNAYRVRVHASF